MPPLTWFLGTMGYGYKDWEGVFYPAGLKSRDYLAHYSQFFNAVELDSTFYGTPRPEVVQRWAEQTPAGFIFCPKTPRQITHDQRLVGTEGMMADFLGTMALLGDKLGPVLIQLPPDMSRSEINNLAGFLAALPPSTRYAVEFRHRSWHATATGELLQAEHAAWASTEYLYLPQRVYVTTNFLYIRWIGRHGTYDVKDHEREDKTPRLQTWLADIQQRATEGIDSVYGFFNNDYAGHSPATCRRFKQLVGLPAPPLLPPQQGRLL
ncbi:MAG: DUF72 domain-containing protein [Ardenticatenaceae bacterium]|nr:DUF72 domain-containing protein [Ardenticatenaceae bacterium]